jgi:hypothetical protein
MRHLRETGLSWCRLQQQLDILLLAAVAVEGSLKVAAVAVAAIKLET